MRRLLLVLVALVVAAGAVTTAPASADNKGSDCNPGNNCTGFEHNAYEVTEEGGQVTLNVYAAWCCPTGQGEVDYETFDGSAVAGKDYQRTTGTLTYAANGSGQIRVPISDDVLSEDKEQFVVRLTNFRGSFVDRGYETAVVTILDRSVYEPASESASANGSSDPGVLRTGRGLPTAASARPVGSGSSASGSQVQSSPFEVAAVPGEPGSAGTTSYQPQDAAAAPLPARTGDGGAPVPVLLAILACLVFMTVAGLSGLRQTDPRDNPCAD